MNYKERFPLFNEPYVTFLLKINKLFIEILVNQFLLPITNNKALIENDKKIVLPES